MEVNEVVQRSFTALMHFGRLAFVGTLLIEPVVRLKIRIG